MEEDNFGNAYSLKNCNYSRICWSIGMKFYTCTSHT
jgi:hypothetical protein